MTEFELSKLKNLLAVHDLVANLPWNLETDSYAYFSTSENPKNLIVFTHSGLNIPDHLSEYMKKAKAEAVHNTIMANHDFGTDKILEELFLLADTEILEVDFAIIYYKYSRLFADSNRLVLDEQIVDQPYRGTGIWKKETNKEYLFKDLLDPFFKFYLKIINKENFRFITHVHSMDEYGGGHASGYHELGRRLSRRPGAMIFKKYAFEKNAFGTFGKSYDSYRDVIISDDEIRMVSDSLTSYIGKDTEILIDHPYISPRQLCGLTIKDTPSQLVIDIRKDLLSKDNVVKDTTKSLFNINQRLTLRNSDPYESVDKGLWPLVRLMSINSYTLNRSSINQKLEYIKNELFKGLKIDWSFHKDNRYADLMIGRTKFTTGPVIGLLLHADTVHVTTESLPIHKYKNKLYGPGASDMQASFFVIAEALNRLQEKGLLKNIILIFNPAEEKGSPVYSEEFRILANEIDYLMVYESSGQAGNPIDKEFFKKIGLVTSRKGIFMQGIKCIGPGGHSGVLTKKSERKNAISSAIKVMSMIDSLSDYKLGTTINLASVNGGRKNTVIAEDCEFFFDGRFKTEEERTRLKNSIDRIILEQVNLGLQFEDLGYYYDLPSFQENKNTKEFLELVKNIAAKDGFKITSESRGGWSDICNFYNYNPKIKALDGFGPIGGDQHTNEEFVYIDSIAESINLSEKIIEGLLEGSY